MNRPHTQPPVVSPANAPLDRVNSPAGVPSHASEGLALIKPSVRAQAAYTLAAPPARRKLNQNECPFDFPAELKREVLERVSAAAWQRYPEFAPPDLLAMLADRYGWVADGVLVGNGSNELIQATLSVTLGAGDVVVAPSPTFSLYRLLTAVLGGRYVPVPLGDGFVFDVDGLIDAARRESARVIVLNSPNNPTGSALPEGAVERILAQTEALVVCDEAYQDFGGPSALGLLDRSSRARRSADLLQGTGPGRASVRACAGASGGGARDSQGQASLQREPDDPGRRTDRARSRAGARRPHPRDHRDSATASSPGFTMFRASRFTRPRRTSSCCAREAFRPRSCFAGFMMSTASWSATSPDRPSWRSACGFRSGRLRTWMR